MKEVLKDKYTDEEGDHCYRGIKVFFLHLHIIYIREKQREHPGLPLDNQHILHIEEHISDLEREMSEYAASRPAIDPTKQTYLCEDCIWIPEYDVGFPACRRPLGAS